jgi:hypothetical protein
MHTCVTLLRAHASRRGWRRASGARPPARAATQPPGANLPPRARNSRPPKASCRFAKPLHARAAHPHAAVEVHNNLLARIRFFLSFSLGSLPPSPPPRLLDQELGAREAERESKLASLSELAQNSARALQARTDERDRALAQCGTFERALEDVQREHVDRLRALEEGHGALLSRAQAAHTDSANKLHESLRLSEQTRLRDIQVGLCGCASSCRSCDLYPLGRALLFGAFSASL